VFCDATDKVDMIHDELSDVARELQPAIDVGGSVGSGRLRVRAPTFNHTLIPRLPRPPINAP